MSKILTTLDSISAPCDKCNLARECATKLKCCDGMAEFIDTGWATKPTKPSHTIYDRVFGKAYRFSDYVIVGLNHFLSRLNVEDSKKTEECSEILLDLYTASTCKDSGFHDKELSLDWEWLFCVSRHTVAPMLMGAVGFERSPGVTYVSYLYTRDQYKGMGVGSRLMDVVESHSDAVFLYPEDNSSHRWYSKRGYQKSEYGQNTWVKPSKQSQPSII